MKLVCLDTQILFWAIVRRPPQNDVQLVEQAIGFMEWLNHQKVVVIIPSIVVGEMLTPIADAEGRNNLMIQFQHDWLIADYNVKAAFFFAEMRRADMTKNRLQELRRLNIENTRKEISADLMIIATARAYHVDTLFSYDETLFNLSRDYLEARNFRDVPIQLPLLDEDDSESDG